MPANPPLPGLVAQGWNWELEEAQDYVAKYGALVIGQMYTTDDGATRLYMQVPDGRKAPTLYWSQTDANGVEIDWGDGTDIDKVSSSGSVNKSHTYESGGEYVISMKVVNGTMSLNAKVLGSELAYAASLRRVEVGDNVTSIGDNAFNGCILLGVATIPNSVYEIGQYAFNKCTALTSITVPQSVNRLQLPNITASWTRYGITYSFNSVSQELVVSGTNTNHDESYLSAIGVSVTSNPILPKNRTWYFSSDVPIGMLAQVRYKDVDGVERVLARIDGDGTFQTVAVNGLPSNFSYVFCYVVGFFAWATTLDATCHFEISDIPPEKWTPYGVLTIGRDAFNKTMIKSPCLPRSLTIIPQNGFADSPVTEISIPEPVTELGDSALAGVVLDKLVIPEKVATLGPSALGGIPTLSELHFKKATPPTVSNANTFQYLSTDCKLYVPSGKLSAYEAASNYPDPDTYTYVEE